MERSAKSSHSTDLSGLFKFELEERLQCLTSNKVEP